jgi:hypothetical protein
LAVFLVILFLGLAYFEVSLWWKIGETVQQTMDIYFFPIGTVNVSGNTWLLILVLVTGALGSFIHVATSLADFVGNRQSTQSWSLWYVMRAPIGAALAVVVYFVLRASLINVGTNTPSEPNVYTVATVAALTGIFSKQAIDKLNELLDVLFRPAPDAGDGGRHDQLTPPAPPPPNPPGP